MLRGRCGRWHVGLWWQVFSLRCADGRGLFEIATVLGSRGGPCGDQMDAVSGRSKTSGETTLICVTFGDTNKLLIHPQCLWTLLPLLKTLYTWLVILGHQVM